MANEKRDSGFALTTVFFVGGLIGAILSLLLAPQSGRRTRKHVQRASIDAQRRLAEATHKAGETINDLVDKGIERIHEALEDHRLELSQKRRRTL
jgi:gas vesicle protein